MQVSRYAVWAETEHGDAVFSGVSGALLPLQPGERRCIETFVATGEPTGVSPERLKELVQARVLVASDRSELETLRARYNRSKYDSAVLSLTLITSLGCNFDCPYCYESKRPSLMNPEVQQAILDMVDDGRSRLTELNVTWMGGEPLVGKNSLYALAEQLIERCDQYGIEYSSDIVTNGWLLDEATAQRLVDLRCTHAQVTIDGPPDLHNSMRPYVGGGPTFDRIVENLTQVADIIPISVRVNIDESNLYRSEELFEILDAAGLRGRLTVYPAKMTYYEDNPDAPVATYQNRCYSSEEFASVELDFNELARRYGFARFTAPQPSGVACSALAANALVIGSEGEVWKCWDDVGNNERTIGDIRNYRDLSSEGLLPWLSFNPADDPQCSTCVALPVCMGGCLHLTQAGHPREAQCGSFRFNHEERVRRATIESYGGTFEATSLATLDLSRAAQHMGATSTVAVQLSRKPAVAAR